MAQIRNIRLAATKATGGGNNWKMTVTYDAVFTAYEVQQGFRYQESFQLWEDDPINDDKLSGHVAISQFAATSEVMRREMSNTFSQGTLNTEWGDEELYAKVFLTNLSLSFPDPRNSPILKLPV
jgi:hypothetical protein